MLDDFFITSSFVESCSVAKDVVLRGRGYDGEDRIGIVMFGKGMPLL